MASYGTYNTPGGFKLTIYGIVIVACFLIMFYLVRNMYRKSDPGLTNRARAIERAKTRRELNDKASAQLASAGWVDKPKGIVRLPIARAMELTVQAAQNPDLFRSNLVERSQKAATPLPPQSFE